MANKKTPEYTNDSIDTLEGAARVRTRPAVIFGSDGLEGCEHSAFEILSNSVDEAREGYGKKIIITKYKDGSVEVEDFGRGIPVDYNTKKERYNWELLFCEMYAGGKYNSSNYEYSLGLNGLGLCATQYASRYMDVEIKRDGYIYSLHFERGENVGGLTKTEYSGRQTGSKIKWLPDNDVFTDINIPDEYFHETIKRQAVVNAGILFVLKIQKGTGFETTEYKYDGGIVQYVEETVNGDELTPVQTWKSSEYEGSDDPAKADKKYKVKLEASLCFSNKIYFKEFYHNSSYLKNGGSPDKAVRNAFLYQIDLYLRNNNKYKKDESKITFADIEECLVIVISSFSTETSYENQTKFAITNRFIQEAMTDFFKKQLEVYFIENKADAEKIAEQVLINKRSRERSEKERLNIKKTLQTKNDMANKVAKFVDCRSKDVAKREVYIVEGDSALGSVKLARDPDFQAVIPIRGKILNCLKADFNRIFQSPIITDLIKVLGCGVEVKTKANKDMSLFSLDNLKWSKVVICTDADVDGFQIRTLVLTLIYRLMPTLIEKGYVFIAETPLYEINTKNNVYFAYDENEKNKILNEMVGTEKYTIQRSKGLGENQPDMMSLTTMNPKTRRLIKVTPADAEATSKMFDLLLGDDLQGRKDYIAENGYKYLDDVDLS